MLKRESKAVKNPMLKSGIISVAFSVLLVLALSALGAVLILRGVLPEKSMGIWAAGAVFLAALLGPIPLIKTVGQKRLVLAYSILGILLAIMVVTKWLAFPHEDFSNLWPLVTGFAGATMAGLLGSRRPKRKKH